ncbi:condensation domain-containing protein [Streptomyces tubbatahanensis]|uniref:condensation domain-containing protein n=1 Tax=Streptomyces tubbatahanensis TaxID=2923272 RepID=UPI003C6EAA5D
MCSMPRAAVGDRWSQAPVPRAFRSPSASNVCGSCTSWRAPAPPTTSPGAPPCRSPRPRRHARGLHDVVERHEILRTVYTEDTDGAHQVLLDGDDARVPWNVEKVTAGEELRGRLERAARYGFDLATEIPIRATFFEQTSDDEHVLLLLLHHIACDGQSVEPLRRDLVTAYEARVHGVAPQWSALPVQYADYAVWQRQLLGNEDDPDSLAARQIGHWTEQLTELPAEIALPTDGPALRPPPTGVAASRSPCPQTPTPRPRLSRSETTPPSSPCSRLRWRCCCRGGRRGGRADRHTGVRARGGRRGGHGGSVHQQLGVADGCVG